MKILLISLTLITSTIITHALQAETVEKDSLNHQAMQLVKQFGSVLKPNLKKAIQSSGPTGAIKVCSEIAPQAAESLSEQSGWDVTRVSMKARNDKTAQPDAWEMKVLKQFEADQAAGKPVKPMKYSEVVDGEFRFMKAVGTEKVCTQCHGSNIKPEVKAVIKQYYPNDVATGYEVGEVRGAFSLRKKL